MGLFSKIQKKKPEFHLENVYDQNKLYPRTFLIPSQEKIDSLQSGALVKLIFIMEKALDNGCRAERMWVKITDKQGSNFTGILDNDPYYLKSIKAGDVISFDSSNIADIHSESSINEELFAIITKKALENKQINWVLRTEDINNEQDSGWQLFYGDESQEYLDDAQNAAIVSLKHVLSFEPLLEEVFCSSGKSFEYSTDLNKFVEAQN